MYAFDRLQELLNGEVLNTVHTYFELKIIQNNGGTLFLFLQTRLHELFHYYIKTTPCCSIEPSCDSIRTHGKLTKEQFDLLFENDSSVEPIHEKKENGRITQHCICPFSPKSSTKVAALDFTLINCLIKTCRPTPAGDRPTPAGDPEWLKDILYVRNKMSHVGGASTVTDIQITEWWEKLEEGAVKIASTIGEIYQEAVKKRIERMKTLQSEHTEMNKKNDDFQQKIMKELRNIKIQVGDREVPFKISNLEFSEKQPIIESSSDKDCLDLNKSNIEELPDEERQSVFRKVGDIFHRADDLERRLQLSIAGKEVNEIHQQMSGEITQMRKQAISIQQQLLRKSDVCSSPGQLECALRKSLLLHQKNANDIESVEKRLKRNCRAMGLRFKGSTPRNGNCFFEAVSSQLNSIGLEYKSPNQLRQEVVEYLIHHKIFQGNDGPVDIEQFMSGTFQNWCYEMKQNGVFADHIIVLGMAQFLQTDIMIVTSSPRGGVEHNITWINGKEGFSGSPILLGHYWENHYQSLEPKLDTLQVQSVYDKVFDDASKATIDWDSKFKKCIVVWTFLSPGDWEVEQMQQKFEQMNMLGDFNIQFTHIGSLIVYTQTDINIIADECRFKESVEEFLFLVTKLLKLEATKANEIDITLFIWSPTFKDDSQGESSEGFITEESHIMLASSSKDDVPFKKLKIELTTPLSLPKKEPEDTIHAQVHVKSSHLPKGLKKITQIDISGQLYDCTAVDNKFVICNCESNRLVITDSNGSNVRDIRLSGPPSRVTAIDDTTVAINIGRDHIDIIQIYSGERVRRLSIDGKMRGLCYHDNHLYMGVERSKEIQVIDLHGKFIKNIPTESKAWRICIDQKQIYYSNYYNDSLACILPSGKPVWKVEPPLIEDLRGLTLDEHGNLYTTFYKSHKVISLPPDGGNIRQLLSESDGLRNPRGICYNSKLKTLMVCNQLGPVFLFNIVK